MIGESRIQNQSCIRDFSKRRSVEGAENRVRRIREKIIEINTIFKHNPPHVHMGQHQKVYEYADGGPVNGPFYAQGGSGSANTPGAHAYVTMDRSVTCGFGMYYNYSAAFPVAPVLNFMWCRANGGTSGASPEYYHLRLFHRSAENGAGSNVGTGQPVVLVIPPSDPVWTVRHHEVQLPHPGPVSPGCPMYINLGFDDPKAADSSDDWLGILPPPWLTRQIGDYDAL